MGRATSVSRPTLAEVPSLLSGSNSVLISFPVSNPCKQVCSHLCLLRPGGYSCACPQGSDFITGSTVQCDAGENPHCLGSLGAFRSSEDPVCCDLCRFNLEVARKGDEGTRNCCVRLWVQSCCYLCYKDISKTRFSVRLFLLSSSPSR